MDEHRNISKPLIYHDLAMKNADCPCRVLDVYQAG